MPLPEKIANAPELAPGLDLFYVAFLELATCRTSGWGEGPIPWTAIDRYAEANAFEGEQREDLFHHVRAMDQGYLAWARARESKGVSHG
jgi:hypothetical protein